MGVIEDSGSDPMAFLVVKAFVHSLWNAQRWPLPPMSYFMGLNLSDIANKDTHGIKTALSTILF